MFHAAAVPAAHITMLRSGYLALILRRFDLALYLHTMKKYKITEGTLVPPIILALVMSPQATPDHFSAIICTLCGAAPLSLDLQRRFEQKLPKEATCTQVWGMTETSCVASKMDPGEKDDTGSVGYLVPGLEAKLLDDKGSEIREYGKPGEMCVRGITVFQGYHMNEQTNRESFDEEGFYKTGDIMYCDEKTKKWYIVDRKKASPPSGSDYYTIGSG